MIELLYEWTDPRTGESHKCPSKYISMHRYLQIGANDAILGESVLRMLGEDSKSQVNHRHLRQAAMILRKQGIFVLSIRSSKGGYFLAANEQEICDYVESQVVPAQAMIENANDVLRLWKELNRNGIVVNSERKNGQDCGAVPHYSTNAG